MTAATMSALLVLATEGGIPGSDWRAQVAVPIGLVLFIGSVYLLLRANLGTRRGYLVMATSLWGFMVIYALFWSFGAPGTPPGTGPQTLPGQELDAYEAVWRPFAGDSNIASQPPYQVVKSFPEGFAQDPAAAGLPADFNDTADGGADEIQTFFSGDALNPKPIGVTWIEVEGSRRFARAGNGWPILAVTYQATYQPAPLPPDAPEGAEPVLTVDGATPTADESNVAPPGAETGDPVEGLTYTAFAFFDPGSPLFPSLVMLAIVTVLFALHVLLLWRDENRERREREIDVAEPRREPVEAGSVKA